MPKTYVVRQGDYLKKLAYTMGFDADVVWNDPHNADLKAVRSNSDILLPGDVLYVPDPKTSPVPMTGGTSNDYSATIPEVPVVLRLMDMDRTPLAGKNYTVYGLGEPLTGTTDGGGTVTFSVPLLIREAHLVLEDGRVYQIDIGGLDPIEEADGVAKRLGHLGYYTVLDTAGAPQDEALRLANAVKAFQADQSLPATGEIDDGTRQAILAAHGD